MARKYSSSQGKAGSKKPLNKAPKTWVSYKATEVEALVAKFAKEKLPAAQIGLKLRDTYGIASVKSITGKPIQKIINEKKLNKQLPQDLLDSIGRYIAVKKHLENNKQDFTAKRGTQLALARIGRLATYYKKAKRLEADWKFNTEKAGMYLE